MSPGRVVILGGGVAGLSAAHELAERGFEVHVLEARGIPGGKARSIAVEGSGTGGRRDLPGEHGFRFFPRFYRHLPDTMSRIPFGDDPRGCAGNLVDTTRLEYPLRGRAPIVFVDRFPTDVAGWKLLFRDALETDFGFLPGEQEFFAERLWQIVTSCGERRLDEYEKLGWWEFVGAETRSPAYQKFLAAGLTRSLNACKAQLASTKTIGDILVQLSLDVVTPGVSSDRLLNGPTNDVWIDPWLEHLRGLGVRYDLGWTFESLRLEDGRVAAVVVAHGGRTHEVVGDWYVLAVPLEVMATRLSPELLRADPTLGGLLEIRENVQWMNGIQFYLTEDVPLVHGHQLYVDSEWALTSVSQAQFWPRYDLARFGDGKVRGILSVDISEWAKPGSTDGPAGGKWARHCAPEEIAAETWHQLQQSLGADVLPDRIRHSWFLDPDITHVLGRGGEVQSHDAEPLLVNYVNSWQYRPDAHTRVPNLFLASDYVRTFTDLATMEGANEAARRAVNAIVDASGSHAPLCELWRLHEPAVLAPFRHHDQQRYDRGLPWNGELGIPGEGLLSRILHLGRATDHHAARAPSAPAPAPDPAPPPARRPDGEKLKVAVLGGGMSGLATAYALTSDPAWKDRFESITVYQQGWRLGGKGASGRGASGRIEEHGLHVWMGWYENAFALMRTVYEELDRPDGAPLATWEEAFRPHDFIALGEPDGDGWKNWPLFFPSRPGETPGVGGELPSVWHYVHVGLQGIEEIFRRQLVTAAPPEGGHHGVVGAIRSVIGQVENAVHAGLDLLVVLECEAMLREARSRAHEATRDGRGGHGDHARHVHEHLTRFRHRLLWHLEDRIGRDDDARRLFAILDTAVTCVIGVLAEVPHVGPHALDALDEMDFREFLLEHGADARTVESALVRAFYDLLFAYRDGNPDDQRVAAGVAVRFIFRMVATYRGSIFWKMQAGMGDTVFAPLHDVLTARGVGIELFHRVREIEPSADGQSVARIELGRQASVENGRYRPFVDVGGLPCWPSRPLYDQLVEGDELRDLDVDLESAWTPWKERETPVVLDAGADFDVAVLAVPIAAIPYVAPRLVACSERWQRMLEKVETVRTQAVQLWLTRGFEELGWPLPSPVSDTYPEPLDTWADMSHLLPHEAWDGRGQPRSITYFCAPMPGGVPPLDDAGAPARETAVVKQTAADWLGRYAGVLWPDGCRRRPPGCLDWRLLHDPEGRTGSERLDAQFFRANIDPSERYVLSVPGSTRYRLKAGEPDFANLYVTGDWTYTGVNAGCVEGAVMSGLLTANAILGRPAGAGIVGYDTP